MEFETALAKASLDNVALRDPQDDRPQDDVSKSWKLPLRISNGRAFFAALKVPTDPLNVEQPEFMKEVNRQLTETSLPAWKTYLNWQLLHSAAPYLSQASWTRTSTSTSGNWRAQRDQAALEAVFDGGGPVAGRGRRAGICRALFPS